MFTIRTFQTEERLKLFIVLVLVSFALLLTYYFINVLNKDVLFTHFFYIPSILACLWWKRKGLIVTIILMIIIETSVRLFNHGSINMNNYYRMFMLMAISCITVSLSEKVSIAKEELAESAKRYQMIFETTATAMVIVENDTIISLVNSEFEHLSGFSKLEIENKMSWTSFVDGADKITMMDYHKTRRFDPNLPPKKYEFVLIDRKDNRKFIYAKIDLIPGTSKTVASLIDVTELRTALDQLKQEIEQHEIIKRALRESEENLLTFLNSIPEIAFLIDSSGIILTGNMALAAELGKDAKVPIGENIYNLLSSEMSKSTKSRVEEALRSKRPVNFEDEKNGRIFNSYIYPVFDDMKEVTRLAVLSFDVGRQRMIERRLVQNEKLASLGLLVAGIAHEINNPNNFITFNTPILRRYITEMLPVIQNHAESTPDYEICNMSISELKEDIYELLDNIEYGSKRINATISNLRDFSRTHDHTAISSTDINKVIKRVVSLCSGELKKSVSRFELKVPENLPLVVTHPEALEQVLVNLIINACQAQDKEHSRLELSVSQSTDPNESLIIEVCDNGCGMDNTIEEKAFDPFFTTKDIGKGTGLGLYRNDNPKLTHLDHGKLTHPLVWLWVSSAVPPTGAWIG